MKKRTFVKNAAILTATSIILRAVGIFFRIYISNRIGAEGMGLHALIFTVYTFSSAIASSGVGVAVTRLVADEIAGGRAAVRSILSKALGISLLLGFGAMGAMYALSDWAAIYWLCDVRAAMSLRILSFGLPFMAVSACLKGYFMARRNARTPSDSQLFEQLVRIACVVLLLPPMAKHGLAYACAAVVIGNATSEVAACAYIWIGYRLDLKKLSPDGRAAAHVLSRLCAIFVPIAVTGYINTALHMVENLLVPQALTRYTSDTTLSLSQFGMLKGMALPILFFPASFLLSLSALLVPEMSAYGAKNQKKRIARTSALTLRITFVSSVLIAGIFIAYPAQIAELLYRDAEVGYYIAALAPIVPFMYLESILTGILHGLNQQTATLKYNIANSVLRMSCILLLVPRGGMPVFLLIMIVSNLLTSLLCLHRLFAVTGLQMDWWRWLIAPTLCCAVGVLCCHAYNRLGSGILQLCGGCAVFCLVYLAGALLTGALERQDIKRFWAMGRREVQKRRKKHAQ